MALLVLFMANPVCSQIRESDSKLTVLISATEKQWGQYLRATLRYHGPKVLRKIDLKPWRQLVLVSFDDAYIDEDEDGNPVQILQLRLYPRKTGALQLPPLKLGAAQSRAREINISPPEIKNSAIKLDWQLSTSSPWQREAVLLRVQLYTRDYAAHIKLDLLENPQFLSRVLKTERHVLADGSYRFDAGWIFYPMDSGLLELDLPAVRYQIAGSDRRQFYLPLQKLQVKPLPNYLPPTLPVGKLDVQSEIIDDEKFGKQWQLNIKTDALIPYGVPELDTQLAAFSKKDIANVEIKYTQQSAYSEYGDRSVYLSPLPDWLLPFGSDLKLSLRFFDTETGRLSEVSHDLPRRWNMPGWAWWLTAAFSLLAGIFVFRIMQSWLLSQTKRLRLHHQLRSAENVKQMRRMILDIGQYVTLSEWYGKNQARKKVVQRLNAYCFSAAGLQDVNATEFQKLKTDLLKLI